MARSEADDQAFWVRTIDRREQTDEDFAQARALVLQTGAVESTLRFAQNYADEAKAALSRFGESPWRDALFELADFAVSRAA